MVFKREQGSVNLLGGGPTRFIMCVFVFRCHMSVVFPVLQVPGFYKYVCQDFQPALTVALVLPDCLKMTSLAKDRAEFPGISSMSMNMDNSRDFPPLFSHDPGSSGTK